MFEDLVESTKNREPGKKLFYFLITATVWSLLFAALVIGGIYSYDSKLNNEYKLLARIAPPLPPPPPPGRTGPSRPASTKPEQPVKQRLALVAPKEIPPEISVRTAPKQIEMPKQAELHASLPASRRDNGSAGL